MKKLLASLALGGLLVSSTSAQIVFSDSLSNTSNWVNYNGGNFHVFSSDGSVLSLSRSAANGHVYLATFLSEAVTLANTGDALTFDFRVRQTGNNGNGANEFVFGIGNDNGTALPTRVDDFGYLARLGAGTGGSQVVRDGGTDGYLGRNDFADQTLLGALTAGYSLPANGSFVDYRMVLERTATGLDITMTRNGADAVVLSDNAVPNAGFYTFNMLSFGYYNRGGTNVSLDVDAMAVTFTAIPEPSTYAALFGLIVLGIVVLRRRK